MSVTLRRMSAGFAGCVLTVLLFAALVAAALGFDFFICTRLPENLPVSAPKTESAPCGALIVRSFPFFSLYFQNIKLQRVNWTFSKILFRFLHSHLRGFGRLDPLDRI